VPTPHYLCPASASAPAPAESMARAALRLGAHALALLVLASGAPASLSARLNYALPAARRRVDRAMHSLGLFRCGAVVELGNMLASDFCVVCGLIERSFVRVMQWLCFRLSVPTTTGTNTARVSSGAGRIPLLRGWRTGTN
jgi:hypothetical protein